MRDETFDVTRESTGGLSRRTALRAGVAAGVGVAAWSGASITSFGGTPAYAAGCTGAIPPVDISGGCRNTTQASGCNPFGYQPEVFNPPAGYALDSIGNNVCCNLNTAATFTYPLGQTCTLTFTYYDSKCGDTNPPPTLYGSTSFGPSNPAMTTMGIQYRCPTTVVGTPNWSNAQYTISAFCFTGSTPPDPGCF